ncbi:MAG TPA: hypothetical protein PLN25_05735 [Deltaproteobacteria bacterium]|nr:hypothetical protein [Deltaproteobacteria bacterium]HQB39156.1 hypothetical protein [Deltaproteobacteria bacterium]
MASEVEGRGAGLYERACREMDSGNVLSALSYVEAALKEEQNTAWYSLYGFCIAKERGHLKSGLDYCNRAIEADPDNQVHYLFLGRLQLISGNKPAAIAALRQGLQHGGNPQIVKLLHELGTRKPLLFKELDRNHPTNRYLGKLLSRLGLR